MIHGMEFSDYAWKNGRPVGIKKWVDEEIAYKVVADPYYKRISLEKYVNGVFNETLYDSAVFDFRHLRQEEANWQREVLKEEDATILSLVRNGDDRVIFLEKGFFQGEHCLECQILSPQGLWLATQKIFDVDRGDPWNGVSLMDRNDKVILQKKYAKDSHGAFGTLLEEVWTY